MRQQQESGNVTVMARLLTPKQAAEKLNFTEHFLERARSTGLHAIPFVRIGRTIRYREIDLDRWVEKQLVVGPESVAA